MDSANFIGTQVKGIMAAIAGIDPYFPDEDMMEVLIGSVSSWGAIEAELLFTALEVAFEGSEDIIEPARQRLNTLYALQESMHNAEGAEEPYNEQALKYIDGVKYHLAADIQDIVPLAAQLPVGISQELALNMSAMKQDLE
jgi:virulence-associated protein VagC